MNEFTPNKWVLIGIVGALLFCLLFVGILMLGSGSGNNNQNAVLNNPSSTTAVPTTTASTATMPTARVLRLKGIFPSACRQRV